MNNTSSLGQHPDSQALRDWPLYGSRDPAIAILVERLALEQKMRVSDIEQLIVGALNVALAGER